MKQTETRPSLLLRIRNPGDRDAWAEFSMIYRPAIVRIARRRGLQNADAEDLAQGVLLSVSGAINKWESDSGQAKFRTWLGRVISNAVCNALSRRKPDMPTGGDANALNLVHSIEDTTSDEELNHEVKREVFRFVAERVRPDFQSKNWDAFWLTAVEGMPIDVVANRLEIKRGSVYAARSRVMRAIKTQVQELDLTEWEVE